MSFKPLSDIYNAYNTAYQGQVQKRQAGEDRNYELQQRDYQGKMQEYNMQDVVRKSELNQMQFEAEKNLDKPWNQIPHLQSAKEMLLQQVDPSDTESINAINSIFNPNNSGRVVGQSLPMLIDTLKNKQQRYQQEQLVSVPLFNAGTGKVEIARVPAKEVDNYKAMSDAEEKNYKAEQGNKPKYSAKIVDGQAVPVEVTDETATATDINLKIQLQNELQKIENTRQALINQGKQEALTAKYDWQLPDGRPFSGTLNEYQAQVKYLLDQTGASGKTGGGSGSGGGNNSGIFVGEGGFPAMVTTEQPKPFVPNPNTISAGGLNFNVDVPLTAGQTFNVEPIVTETNTGELPASILPTPVAPQTQTAPQPIQKEQATQPQPYTQEEVMGTPQTAGAITLWKGFPIEKAKDMGINLNDNITRPGGIVPLAPGYMGEKVLMDRFIGKYFAPQYYGSPKTYVAVPVANAEGVPYRAEVVEFGSQDYKDLVKQFEYERAIKLSNGKWTSKKSMEEQAKKDLENAKTQAERDRLLLKIANDNRNFDKALAETVRSNKADESIDRARITKPIVPKPTKPITNADNAFALYQANFDALTKLPSLSNTTDPNKRAETTKIAILASMEEGATLRAILEKIAKNRGLTNANGKVLSNNELETMYNASDTAPVVKYRIDEYRLAQRAGDIASKEKVKGTTSKSLLKPYATLTPKGK